MSADLDPLRALVRAADRLQADLDRGCGVIATDAGPRMLKAAADAAREALDAVTIRNAEIRDDECGQILTASQSAPDLHELRIRINLRRSFHLKTMIPIPDEVTP